MSLILTGVGPTGVVDAAGPEGDGAGEAAGAEAPGVTDAAGADAPGAAEAVEPPWVEPP